MFDDAIQAFSKVVAVLQEICNKLVKSLEQILPAHTSSTMPRKPQQNYFEYKYIKPNTKPYSAYKRLYRGQEIK